MRYDKLVRDGIPAHIASKGEAFTTRTADDAEYWEKLKAKLCEESDEFDFAEEIGELADIMEVIHAILAHKGWTLEELERVRAEKARAKGTFRDRVILVES